MLLRSKLIVTIFVAIFMPTIMVAKNWNMATPYVERTAHTKNNREFIEEIKQKSKGKFNITLHSGASLYKSPEIFRAVRSRQIELGEILIANLGNDNPIFKVDSIPFLATSYKDAKKLWDASKDSIKSALEKKGVKLLYAVPWPPQNFYTKDKVENIAYFKGSKFRTYNAITSNLATLLDASPTTIQIPEIPQAFSTGVIDIMISSSTTGISTQAWDFVKYFTKVQSWLPKNMVFINKKVWDRLDNETRRIFLEAAKNAEKRGWKASMELDKKDTQTLADHGVIVSQGNEQLKKSLSIIGQKMIDKWLQETGDIGKSILDKYKNSKK